MPFDTPMSVARRPVMSVLCVAFAVITALLVLARDARASDYLFRWAHPLPQGNPLGGAAFENSSVGYAVGSRGSVVKTTDGGATWQLVSHFPEASTDLTDLVILAPGELLAVGAAPGIFHSIDGGASWSAVPNPSTGRLEDIEAIAPGILSAVGAGGQVLRSGDGGQTWSLLGSAGADLGGQLWLDASNGYVMGMNRVRRTTNGGASWSPLPGITDGDRFNAGFFTDALHGYIVSDFKFWKSTDGGASWTGGFFAGGVVYCGDAVVLGPQHFLVATNLEGAMIARTTDGGTTWTHALMTGGGGFLDFDRLPDGTLIVVGSEGDIYRSTDNGVTWTDTIQGREPYRAGIGAIGAWPGAHGAAGSTGTPGQQWYRSDDAGSTWVPDPTGPSVAFSSEIAYWDAQHAIAAGDYGKIWRSTDGGVTWSSAPLPGAPVNGAAWHISLPAPGIAFAAVTGQSQSLVYRTLDYGASWQQRSTGIPVSGGLTGVSFPNANVGFASGYTTGSAGRMFKTTDGGGSWTPVTPSGLPAGWTWDLHFHDALTGVTTMGGASSGIYRTTNGGGTWTLVSSSRSREMSFSDALHGVAGVEDFGEDGTVVVTDDGGATWQTVLLPAVLTGSAVAAVADGFLVGGAAGVIVKATRVLTSVESGGAPGQGMPARNGRLTASPSVGPEVAIEFELEHTGHAQLDVIDVRGRRVTTLRSGMFAAGARTAIAWNGTTDRGERAASGTYFIRLVDEEGATALRIVLIR